MKNVFIAVGGSGVKVAEALVRLLGVGFPTHKNNQGTLTSAGQSLEIWRVDPDASSGAAKSLQDCVDQYNALQVHLRSDMGDVASSWAMDIAPKVSHLNPLDLPSAAYGDNQTSTLRGILDSNYVSTDGKINSSGPILSSFYEEKDLAVEIDRGFYQKPFIGAAVMATYAESLQDTRSPGGRACNLAAFNGNKTKFFLCGSLHGGTGASGVPVMGRYFNSQKQDEEWTIGACLLTPYTRPPQPPFKPLPAGQKLSDIDLQNLIRANAEHPAFKELGTPEQKEKLARQILDGFFADPEAMEQRARQGLAYYHDHASNYFDELYIVGKPEPDTLPIWSNGGSSQRNPPNSAEVVAALAALNFFAGAGTGDKDSYVIGTTPNPVASNAMNLRGLPCYQVGGSEIEPEKVFLTTAATTFLLLNGIPWDKPVGAWGKECPALFEYYDGNDIKKNEDRNRYTNAAALLATFVMTTLDKTLTIGWSGEDAASLSAYFSNDAKTQEPLLKSVQKGFFGSEAKGLLQVGDSAIKLTTFDFNQFPMTEKVSTRGEYLRFAWTQLFRLCKDKNNFAK